LPNRTRPEATAWQELSAAAMGMEARRRWNRRPRRTEPGRSVNAGVDPGGLGRRSGRSTTETRSGSDRHRAGQL